MVVEDTTTVVEDTITVVDDTTVAAAVEEAIVDMVAVVVDVTTTEGAGVAALMQRQLHTNKLMRPKLTTDIIKHLRSISLCVVYTGLSPYV